MIDLDAAIERAETMQEVKTLLKQIVSAINVLDGARGVNRGDLIFKDEGKGTVLRGSDGNYYRQTISVSGATVSTVYTNIGPRPEE